QRTVVTAQAPQVAGHGAHSIEVVDIHAISWMETPGRRHKMVVIHKIQTILRKNLTCRKCIPDGRLFSFFEGFFYRSYSSVSSFLRQVIVKVLEVRQVEKVAGILAKLVDLCKVQTLIDRFSL